VGALFSKIGAGPNRTDAVQKSKRDEIALYLACVHYSFVTSVSRYNHQLLIQFSEKYVLLFHNIIETSGKSQGRIKAFSKAAGASISGLKSIARNLL